MVFIFSASTDMGSVQHTSRIIGPLLRWLKPDISDETIARVQFVVRKGGHLTEDAVLALLVWRARRKPVKADARPWNRREVAIALTVAVLYSASDEIHQAFVPTREARVGDVLIDTTGAALGLAVLWGSGRLRRRW